MMENSLNNNWSECVLLSPGYDPSKQTGNQRLEGLLGQKFKDPQGNAEIDSKHGLEIAPASVDKNSGVAVTAGKKWNTMKTRRKKKRKKWMLKDPRGNAEIDSKHRVEIAPASVDKNSGVAVTAGKKREKRKKINARKKRITRKGREERNTRMKGNTGKEKGDYISNDQRENKDNFDSEWELLRGLETDQERYKAVQKCWGNLVTPDPSRDLTYFSWKLKQIQEPTSGAYLVPHDGTSTAGADKALQKREPDSSVGTGEPPQELACTRPYTAFYDEKIGELNRCWEEEKLRMFSNREVEMLRQEEQQDMEYMNSLPNLSEGFLRDMQHRHEWDRDQLAARLGREFDHAALQNNHKLQQLDKGRKGVEMYSQFYSGVQHDGRDKMGLHDQELQELQSTDRLYEKYKTFYSG